MVIGQTIRHCLPEHWTHRAIAAVRQLSEEERFFVLMMPKKISDREKKETSKNRLLLVTQERQKRQKDCKRSTHSFRYLQIITATFSQFFLVGQNTRHECAGITSVTRAMMWSGSIFCMELEY